MRSLRLACALGTCLMMLAGCSLLNDTGGPGGAASTAESESGREAALVMGHLEALAALARAEPTDQATMADDARALADTDPTASNQLRHALVLAIPGHEASDLVAARTALETLLGAPHTLTPSEISLANIMLRELDARYLLEERQRLRAAESVRQDQAAVQTLTRRLQAQTTENVRLQKELAEALAKLEAVATLERNLNRRRGSPDSTP